MQFNAVSAPVGALTLKSTYMPAGTFDLIYKTHFPEEFANPTIGQIMLKDIGLGIECLEYTGLPLSYDPELVKVCALRAAGELMHHPKVWPVVQAHRLTAVARALRKGVCKNPQRLLDALEVRRNALRMRRNELDGYDFRIAKRKAADTASYPEKFWRTMPEEQQISLFDTLELEHVHRGLHLVCGLQSVISLALWKEGKWRDDTSRGLWMLVCAGWGVAKKLYCPVYGLVQFPTKRDAIAARHVAAKAFLEAYATSGTFGKPQYC